MGDAFTDRRGFLALASRAVVGGVVLGCARPDRARGHDPKPRTFTGLDVFHGLLARARDGKWSEHPIGERIGEIGLALRDTPYVDATLELYEDREVCSVNFRGLDCVTFFESALGVARMLRRGGHTPEALLAELTFTRYRGGKLTDYVSRLHYLTDWFFDGEQKGVVRMVTDLPGTAPFTQKVSYMSRHPEAYRQLKANPAMVRKIEEIEARINARSMTYVPKAQVAAAQPLLATGDIIGVTTSFDGLDCAHSGLVYRQGGVSRFLHGSTTAKKVVLDVDLATYLTRVSTHTGIMVARPVEVA